MDDRINELDLDKLEGVPGGTKPELPVSGAATNRPYDLGSDITGAEAGQLPQVFAYCRLCGTQTVYLGQTRVEGGNTGEYKCVNPGCANCNRILYNEEVEIL